MTPFTIRLSEDEKEGLEIIRNAENKSITQRKYFISLSISHATERIRELKEKKARITKSIEKMKSEYDETKSTEMLNTIGSLYTELNMSAIIIESYEKGINKLYKGGN